MYLLEALKLLGTLKRHVTTATASKQNNTKLGGCLWTDIIEFTGWLKKVYPQAK